MIDFMLQAWTSSLIELSGALSADQKSKLLEIADKCPVHRTLHGEIKVATRLLS